MTLSSCFSADALGFSSVASYSAPRLSPLTEKPWAVQLVTSTLTDSTYVVPVFFQMLWSPVKVLELTVPPAVSSPKPSISANVAWFLVNIYSQCICCLHLRMLPGSRGWGHVDHTECCQEFLSPSWGPYCFPHILQAFSGNVFPVGFPGESDVA